MKVRVGLGRYRRVPGWGSAAELGGDMRRRRRRRRTRRRRRRRRKTEEVDSLVVSLFCSDVVVGTLLGTV